LEAAVREKQGTKQMHCKKPELQVLIPFYLHGNVTKLEAAELEGHVAECEDCQEQTAMWAVLLEQDSCSR
jgi:hypothetical protein